MDDWSLLQKYVVDGSADALDELVWRHMPLGYAAALREVGEANLAEDVTQAVFLVLMRHAARIPRRAVLAGWLFNVTRFAAAKAKRSAARQKKHEQKAAAMKTVATEVYVDAAADQLQPLLN